MSPKRIVTIRLLLVTASIQRMRITAKVKIIVHNPQKRILYFQNALIAYNSSTEITVSWGIKVHVVFEQRPRVQNLLWPGSDRARFSPMFWRKNTYLGVWERRFHAYGSNENKLTELSIHLCNHIQNFHFFRKLGRINQGRYDERNE